MLALVLFCLKGSVFYFVNDACVKLLVEQHSDPENTARENSCATTKHFACFCYECSYLPLISTSHPFGIPIMPEYHTGSLTYILKHFAFMPQKTLLSFTEKRSFFRFVFLNTTAGSSWRLVPFTKNLSFSCICNRSSVSPSVW